MPRIGLVLPAPRDELPTGQLRSRETTMAKHRTQQSVNIWTVLMRTFRAFDAATEFVQRVVGFISTVALGVAFVVQFVPS